jgi:light-regulated signal transduction histidine kinase (bacteriophytochrome)
LLLAFAVHLAQRSRRSEGALQAVKARLEERVRDRTAQLVVANDELKVRAEQLARSNTDLEQFAYVASHDLKEPLRMISSYVTMLGERFGDRLDREGKEYLRFATDGAKRLHALIDDLLAYARAGLEDEPIEETDARRIVGLALANLRQSIESSGATIDIGRLPRVSGAPAQLSQVFQNLIGNAIKYRSEAPPRVTIRAVSAGDFWRFTVADNGIGFPPERSQSIFTMFQRLHGAGEYPGTGIGLSICKRIVLRHGGRIWADAEPGRGATFFFTLPKKQTGEPRAHIDEALSA